MFYALNASNGSIIWQRNVGTPITSGLPCGNINPLGITGTPIVDLASRSLFFDAETTPTAGTFKHMIYSLNVDTGDINPGWPVDVSAVVPGFDSSVQSQRAALAIASGILYVPYGGRFGDCGNYRGRLVGVQISNPSGVMAWTTTAIGGGVWGVGGVAVDGIIRLLSLAIPSTRVGFGAVAKRLFVSNPARFLPVHPAITGRLRTG
jgi:outer membrane protein assembly factor BamB